MPKSFGGEDISYIAKEDLSDYQYRFVVQEDDDEVRLANATGDVPLGVLQNNPATGEAAVVRINGTSKIVANDALTVGTFVKNEYVGAADNGKADEADTDKDIVRGVVIMAAGAEDDVAGILLLGPAKFSI